MTRTHWRNLSLLPWLILPAMLWRYWQLQDLLPERIAVHFNANNVPNGWSDRGDFVVGLIGMTVGMLALFTILSLIPKRPKTFSWLLLFFEYFVSVVMCLAFVGVLEFNALNRIDSLRIVGRIAMLTPVVAIVAVVIAVMRAGRKEVGALMAAIAPTSTGSPSVAPSQGRLLAEEIQRAPLAGMFFAIATVLVISAAIKIPSSAPLWVRLLVYCASPLCLWVTLQAWGGFRYRVTSTGIDVRTGGIRVCSIPKATIQDYRIAQIDPLGDFGGWGIRMLPGRRAFIWHGHEAVRIRTPQRTVYLGHDQPERLVKDLDVMMKSV
jgi:Protein of unknown function (DUF1648)